MIGVLWRLVNKMIKNKADANNKEDYSLAHFIIGETISSSLMFSYLLMFVIIVGPTHDLINLYGKIVISSLALFSCLGIFLISNYLIYSFFDKIKKEQPHDN